MIQAGIDTVQSVHEVERHVPRPNPGVRAAARRLLRDPGVRDEFSAALLATALLAAPAIAQEFSFVAIGDMPYGQPSEVYPLFEALIRRIDELDPALVVHVGDTKSGSTLCSDEVLGDQLGYLNSFEAPVLYTPGDNEWTDCHGEAAGGFDPLERLADIRDTYFTKPGPKLRLRKVST